MTWSKVLQSNPSIPDEVTEGVRDQIKRAITRDLGEGPPFPSYLRSLLRDADQKGGTSDERWRAAQAQLNFAAPFQVWGYYQQLIGDDPRQHRELRTRWARELLNKRGWAVDKGFLKGDGMYKFAGGHLQYVTDWEGEFPKLGESLLVGKFVPSGEDEWDELDDQEELSWEEFLRKY